MVERETPKDVIAQTPLVLTKRASQLIQASEQALSNGSPSKSEEIAAAMSVVATLAKAASEILGNPLTSGIIFDGKKQKEISSKSSENHVSPSSPSTNEGGEKKPTTWNELFELKIQQLVGEKERMTIDELRELLTDRTGIIKERQMRSLGHNGKVFIAEEAIQALKTVLLADTGQRLLGRLSYRRQDLLVGLRMSADELDALGSPIGYSWKQKPSVDNQTAKIIRGLVRLNKLVESKTLQTIQ